MGLLQWVSRLSRQGRDTGLTSECKDGLELTGRVQDEGASGQGITKGRHQEQGILGTSSVVQWLKLLTVNAGDLGLIPDQGIRSPKPQLKVGMLQLRPSAAKLIFKIK